jgi:hypothetical protein
MLEMGWGLKVSRDTTPPTLTVARLLAKEGSKWIVLELLLKLQTNREMHDVAMTDK